MSKKRHTALEKMRAIRAYEEGTGSMTAISSRFGISVDTLKEWRGVYRNGGLAALEPRKSYTTELKRRAVRDVLEGRESIRSATKKYGLSDKSVLKNWITQYNGHREINERKRRTSMTKGRQTTFEERIEAVLDCIGRGKDYHGAAETHRVSYQQIYSWVRKYEKDGPDGLMDQRGRTRTDEELTAEERHAIEKRRLELENERLRAEIMFLKKLEEIERRRN